MFQHGWKGRGGGGKQFFDSTCFNTVEREWGGGGKRFFDSTCFNTVEREGGVGANSFSIQHVSTRLKGKGGWGQTVFRFNMFQHGWKGMGGGGRGGKWFQHCCSTKSNGCWSKCWTCLSGSLANRWAFSPITSPVHNYLVNLRGK